MSEPCTHQCPHCGSKEAPALEALTEAVLALTESLAPPPSPAAAPSRLLRLWHVATGDAGEPHIVILAADADAAFGIAAARYGLDAVVPTDVEPFNMHEPCIVAAPWAGVDAACPT